MNINQTTDNLNPTDKVIQIAKEVIDSFDKIRPKGAGRNTEMPFDDFALICNAKNNLRQALTAYEKSKEEPPPVKNEISDLLCLVAQLIQGWNATEQEWSEWDKEVYNKVVAMQFKLSLSHTPESEMQELSKDELIERLTAYQWKASEYDKLHKALNDIASKESETEKYIKGMSKVSREQMQEPYMASQLPTQEPESKDGKTKEEILDEFTWQEFRFGVNVDYKNALKSMQLYADQQVSKATKDLTDEVERLRARIGELEKQSTKRICHKAGQCANTPGGLVCPKDVICPI